MTLNLTPDQTLQYLFPSCELRVVVANEDGSSICQLPVTNFYIQTPEVEGVLTRSQKIEFLVNSRLTISAQGWYYGSSTCTNAPMISHNPDDEEYYHLSERNWHSIHVGVQLYNTTTGGVKEIAQQTFSANAMYSQVLQEEASFLFGPEGLPSSPSHLSDFHMSIQNEESTVSIDGRELHRFQQSPIQVSGVQWRNLSLGRVLRWE